MEARIKIIVVFYKFLYKEDADPYCYFGVTRIWNSSDLVSIFNKKSLDHLCSSPSTFSNFYVFSMEVHNPSTSLGDFSKTPHIRTVLNGKQVSKITPELELVDIFRSELENAGGKDVNLMRVWKKN